jgi:hypothetical protein
LALSVEVIVTRYGTAAATAHEVNNNQKGLEEEFKGEFEHV